MSGSPVYYAAIAAALLGFRVLWHVTKGWRGSRRAAPAADSL
jgi:hypothetical protein